MSAFTIKHLAEIMPKADAATWYSPLAVAMTDHGINTKERQAAFLAQLAHESLELRHVEENLHYSREGLLKVWPARFPPEIVNQYAKQPEKIANRAYGNRLGNGDEASGDGWKYRGRGPIQVTGKANYQAASDALGMDLVKDPNAVTQPFTGAKVAAWFWASKGLNALADAGAFREITRKINGGLLGLAEREAYYKKALQVLA